MNKKFITLGFLISLPAYFNDSIAERIQNLGGSLWTLFSNIGFVFYPMYLAIFILPLFMVISWAAVNFKRELILKKTFFELLYGFLISSVLFILFVVIAISQFQFSF